MKKIWLYNGRKLSKLGKIKYFKKRNKNVKKHRILAKVLEKTNKRGIMKL